MNRRIRGYSLLVLVSGQVIASVDQKNAQHGFATIARLEQTYNGQDTARRGATTIFQYITKKYFKMGDPESEGYLRRQSFFDGMTIQGGLLQRGQRDTARALAEFEKIYHCFKVDFANLTQGSSEEEGGPLTQGHLAIGSMSTSTRTQGLIQRQALDCIKHTETLLHLVRKCVGVYKEKIREHLEACAEKQPEWPAVDHFYQHVDRGF